MITFLVIAFVFVRFSLCWAGWRDETKVGAFCANLLRAASASPRRADLGTFMRILCQYFACFLGLCSVCFLKAFWNQNGRKNEQKSIKNRSKIDQKSIKNRSKIDRKSSFYWTSNFDRFFIDFGSVFGANLGPCWGHVGAKLGSKSASKLDDFSSFVFDRFLKPLGIDFEAFWDPKSVPRWVPRATSQNLEKPSKTIGFSRFLSVRGPQKSMKKRLQDKTST